MDCKSSPNPDTFPFLKVGELSFTAGSAFLGIPEVVGYLPCRGATLEGFPQVCLSCLLVVLVPAVVQHGLPGLPIPLSIFNADIALATSKSGMSHMYVIFSIDISFKSQNEV